MMSGPGGAVGPLGDDDPRARALADRAGAIVPRPQLTHGAASRWWWSAAGAAVVRRPSLWVTAIRAGTRLVPSQWWRRWPPLPVPTRAWIAFRSETAYGDGALRPTPRDVISWLEWVATMRPAPGLPMRPAPRREPRPAKPDAMHRRTRGVR